MSNALGDESTLGLWPIFQFNVIKDVLIVHRGVRQAR